MTRDELAGWLADEIGWIVRRGNALFADDAPVKMPAPGQKKTKTARVWTYVRDERPWSGPCAKGAQIGNLSRFVERAPPCARYQLALDQKEAHPVSDLSGYKGWVLADGFSGFNGLFGDEKAREMACMAHVRRTFVDVFALQGSAIAEEAIRRIAELYTMAKEAHGKPTGEREAFRQANSRQIFDDLEEWLHV